MTEFIRKMALELTMRHGTVHSPVLVVPNPSGFKRYQRQASLTDSELSPSDTPRKNKRKLSEPKRRTTDFSIKRLCPDSPGSACSGSGRSEGSTPERVNEDPRDSGDAASPSEMPDRLFPHHPHLRPPMMYPDMRHYPYIIPPFYYGRVPPGFPIGATHPHLPGFPHAGMGLPEGPPVALSVPSRLPATSRSSSQEDRARASPPPSPLPQTQRSRAEHTSKPKKTQNAQARQSQQCASPPPPPKEENDEDEDDDESSNSPEFSKDGKRCRKNYKNMTRERRVEANARERSRVHTISAAFDGLRRAVPSYSYNQKLSKLAILRIACSYINALSKLADSDIGSPESKDSTFAECVDSCTRTIQTEGKARRRH